MARTPLWGRLGRLLRGIGEARRTGVPAAEVIERGPTRRQVLAAAALAPIALGCGPPQRAPARPPGRAGPRVVIVGAGIAGLTCAHRLLERRVDVQVVEAATRIGGRILSDRKTFSPMSCELGGELIDTSHATMLALSRELGVELADYTLDPPAEPVMGYFGGRLLRERDLLEGLQPIAAAVDRAIASFEEPDDKWVSVTNPNGAQKLDAMSITAWLDSVGASGPVRALLEVAYTIEYGLPPDVSSALNLILMVSTELEYFRPFGESDERYRAVGGNDLFVSRLAERVGAARIRLGARLEAVRPVGDGFALTIAEGARVSDLGADHVVLALPFTMLRKCRLDLPMRPQQRRAIAELGYGTNAKLMVGFRERVWRAQGSSGETFTDLPFQSTWETSRLQPGPAGIITNFTGGQAGIAAGEGTTAARARAFAAGFDQLFPGAAAAADGRAVRMHWPSYRFTEGSYSAYLVGQYTTIAGVEWWPVGRVHFCGEHTSEEAQGYMEGGAASGNRAAREVLADLGMPTYSRRAAPWLRRAGAAASASMP